MSILQDVRIDGGRFPVVVRVPSRWYVWLGRLERTCVSPGDNEYYAAAAADGVKWESSRRGDHWTTAHVSMPGVYLIDVAGQVGHSRRFRYLFRVDDEGNVERIACSLDDDVAWYLRSLFRPHDDCAECPELAAACEAERLRQK